MSHSRSQSSGMEFPFPFPFPKNGNGIFIPVPFPKVWEWVEPFPFPFPNVKKSFLLTPASRCNTLIINPARKSTAVLQCGKMLSYWEDSVKCISASKVSIYYQINSTISPNSFYTSCKQLACVTRTHLKAFCGFSSFSHIGVFLVSTVKGNLAGCIP